MIAGGPKFSRRSCTAKGFVYKVTRGEHAGKLCELIGTKFSAFHSIVRLEDGTKLELHRSAFKRVVDLRPVE